MTKGATGGTLDADLKGLELKRPVLALGFRGGHRAGNSLVSQGARSVLTTSALLEAIEAIRVGAAEQLSMFEATASAAAGEQGAART